MHARNRLHKPGLLAERRGPRQVRDVSQVVVGQAWCRCTCLVVESVTTPAESSTTRQFSFFLKQKMLKFYKID